MIAVQRVAILGVGAIGSRVLSGLQTEILPDAAYAAFDRIFKDEAAYSCRPFQRFTEPQALYDWCPDLAVECAGHAVVSSIVPELLRRRTDVVLASIGALVNDALRERLRAAATEGNSRLLTVTGAIGALDALAAARRSGLSSVVYTGRKPPIAWRGTPAEENFDLSRVDTPTVIFEGCARGSAALYPQNANVTAAIALAGVGFDATQVRLFADPKIERNVHQLDVDGGFGSFSVRFENSPLADNPKTSWLAVLSIEQEVRKYLNLGEPW